MKRLAGLAVLAAMVCACASESAESDGLTVALAADGSVVSSAVVPDRNSTTSVPTPATELSTTSSVADSTSTSPPDSTLAPTGAFQLCGAGERLDDPDGDAWGECVANETAVNTWAAQAAAEANGLAVGTPCVYPPTLVAGETAVVTCAVVNWDSSEGSWSFVIASDSSVSAAATYVETKAPPATLPPTTLPQVEPAVSTTDPRFGTCKEAKSNGYGPYYSGQDPEYNWYRDADSDGKVCE